MSRKYRNEEKYLITQKKAEIIRQRVNKIFHLDQHTKQDSYIVTSIYFDDFLNTALKQKLDGISQRYKFRIRIYNNDLNYIILEKKTKHNSQGFKTKLHITNKEYQQLLNNNYHFLEDFNEPLAKEFLILLKARKLKPVIEILYEREAYTLPFNNLRVTFDKNLSYLKEEQEIKVTDNIVLEIKYDLFFPKFLKTIFEDLSLSKLSISKYLICYLHKNGEEINI